jgi:hypothetical protein
VNDFRERLHLPVETAMVRTEDIVDLLLALGAAFDIPTKETTTRGRTPRLLADYASDAAQHFSEALKKRSVEEGKPVALAPVSSASSWAEEREELVRVLKTLRAPGIGGKPARRGFSLVDGMDDDEVERARDYFLAVEKALRAKTLLKGATQVSPSVVPAGASPSFFTSGAMPGLDWNLFNAANPMLSGTQVAPPATSYHRLMSTYQTNDVPLHLKALYDELFEACWAGDNARIEELCLPMETPTSGAQEPVQIVVRTTSAKGEASWSGSSLVFLHMSRRRLSW